jgi:hypothetical protein
MRRIEELLGDDDLQNAKWTVRTLGEVAEFFGCAVQTVKQWRSHNPPMPGTPGEWRLNEIVRWRHAWFTGSDLATAKKQQDLELGRVQLESKQLELDQGRGQLLDRAEVELWAATALIEARVMIMSLPERLSTSAPPEMRGFIREESDRHCRDVLTSLRRRLEMDEPNKTDSDQIPTATGEDPVK